ncbi:MAG: hypothetical protein QM811_16885 [Pirellulales bacterium]
MGSYFRTRSVEIHYNIFSRRWARREIAAERARVRVRQLREFARQGRMRELQRRLRTPISQEHYWSHKKKHTEAHRRAAYERLEDARELRHLMRGHKYYRRGALSVESPEAQMAAQRQAIVQAAGNGARCKVRTTFSYIEVARWIREQERLALLRFAYAVRAEAQASMHPQKAISKPGRAPASHNGQLRNSILYAWDSSSRTVVVGPIRRAGPSGGQAPAALEYGGPSTITRMVNGKIKRVAINVTPRPYMHPALSRVRPRFAPLLRR